MRVRLRRFRNEDETAYRVPLQNTRRRMAEQPEQTADGREHGNP